MSTSDSTVFLSVASMMPLQAAPLRIGIFGGSFDPIHVGHLRAARAACEALSLDRLLFVPTGNPPHKAASNLASAAQRKEMVKLAIGNDDRFTICDIETASEETSFTVNTVRELAATYPVITRWFFILGDDCAANLHRWKGLDELLRRVEFIAIPRGGYEPDASVAARVKTLEVSRLTVSSSEVRRAIAAGRNVQALLPEPVSAYIARHRLYSLASS